MAEEFQITTVQVRPLWNPRFRRHPILWWKTRHLRRVVERLAEAERQSPLLRKAREAEERAFLFGAEKGSTDASDS